MNSLYILIPIAVIFVVLALGVFLWCVRSGQFDDMDSPAYRILFDEKIDSSTEAYDVQSKSRSDFNKNCKRIK